MPQVTEQPVKNLIAFWESTFSEYQFLMSPSVKVIVQSTINKLKKIKENDQT